MDKKEDFRIIDLAHRARFLLTQVLRIHEYYEENRGIKKLFNQDLMSYLVIQHNLCFFDAILIIHTLLKSETPKRKGQELTLEYFLTKKPTNNEKELDAIRSQYKKSNLDQVRDKIIAHKDKNNTGDSINHFLNLVEIKFIKDALEIMDKIDHFLDKNSPSSYTNNFYQIYFSKGNEEVLDLIKRRLDREI